MFVFYGRYLKVQIGEAVIMENCCFCYYENKRQPSDSENESPNTNPKTSNRHDPRNRKFESVKDARRRLRQEWDALKNCTLTPDISVQEAVEETRQKEAAKEVLYGVVAYVEIGNNERHVTGLKNILTSLGASVKNSFSNEVTHVIYKSGSIETYKRAKLLNSHLVSVLWVEACRNSQTKVCERLFPVYDTNDYSNSPRVFRRFMEYQSKHFEYDASIGEIVRKPAQHKPQSLIKNLQKLNIGQSHKTPHTSTAVLPTSKSTTKKLANVSTSSNESVALHISTDDSINISNESNALDKSSDLPININKIIPETEFSNSNTKDIDNDIHLQMHSTKVGTDNLNSENKSLQDDKDVSPSKRRLFATRPLQQSFVNFSQEDNIPRRIIVPNPYCQSINKTNSSNKNLTSNTTEISTKTSKKTPTKKQNVSNKSTKKPAVAMYNGIKMFTNVFKKTHNAFRPPSKYVYSEHKKCPSLVSTSLHSFENKSLKQMVTKLGGFHLKARVDESTTHVVCGEIRRTVNLLKAVARGCWLLNRKWIEDSATAGKWLAEDHYELVEFSKVVRRSRTQKQSFGKNYSLDIFDESGLIYIGRQSAPPYGDLKELITLCGGKVTLNPALAQIVVGEKIDSCPDCVTEKWILDSITFGRCKTLSKYYFDT